MGWLHPHLFWVFILVPAVALIVFWAARRRSRLLSRLGGKNATARLADSVSPRKRRWKSGVLIVAVALLCLALVGPRFGTQIREAKREGVDLIIALDVSLSMQAEDVAPNRLARSKNEIKNLLDELRGDRVGLVLFAGDAFLQCPLTTDYGAVKLFLDVANPSLIPTPGTDFVSALQMAMRAFESAGSDESGEEFGGEERTRALLFVSDGENHIEGIDAALSRARASGIVIYAAGVGEMEGAPIPISERAGQTTYKKDRQGRIVSTRLHEEVLREIAKDGAYFRIARTSSSLNKIIAALDRLDKSEFGSEEFEEYDEKYQWPLALGILLLVGETLLSDRVGRRRRLGGLATLFGAMILVSGCSGPSDDGRRGNGLYEDGRFDEATAAFQEGLNEFVDDTPDIVRSNLLNNQGAAYYRNEEPEAAQNAFINSVAMAENVAEQARGSYNAGNAAFAAGTKQLSADFFRQALLLDPENDDARFNYEFVKRQLDEEKQDEQGGGNEPPPKPSDYAKQLKAQADQLVEQHRYADANALMTDGLKIDPTIRAFQTFIDRTASVADINP